MRRSAVVPFLAGMLVCSLTSPAAANPVAPVEYVIGGVAMGDFTYPLEAGKSFTVQRHVVDPGEVITWNGPSTVVAMHATEGAELTNFPNCNSQQTWGPYPAYYVARSKEAGTLKGVTANLSSVRVEFYTLKSDAIGAPQRDDQLHREPTSPQPGDVIAGEEGTPGEIGDPITAASGCPQGVEGETTPLASGRMATTEKIELSDHTQIVVYRHTLPAGYNSGWYSPYWPTVIVPVTGDIRVAHNCGEGDPQPVGSAARIEGPTLVRSSGAAEYLSVSWNIQNAFPIDVPFYLPELPPASCPESPLMQPAG